MHETGLVRDLIQHIHGLAKRHGAQRVLRVRVRVGALAHMDPDHFREHFVREARGGPAEHARVEVVPGESISDPQAQEILLEDIEVET